MAERWQQWMPFHIDKFRGSPEVQAMHPAARAGYIYLLASMWQTDDCTISADPIDLATESGLGDELWAQYGARIIRKFVTVDGRLRNAVLFDEWSEAKKVYDKRKLGAVRTNSVRSPNTERTQCDTQSEALRDTVTETGTETTTEANTTPLASTADAVPAAGVDRGRVLGTLPCAGGKVYEVCEDDLARDGPLYPAVDVAQEYRAMKGWLMADPRRQKTTKGIRRFMAAWLTRAQDSGKNVIGGTNGTHFKSSAERKIDRDAESSYWANVHVFGAPDGAGEGVLPLPGGELGAGDEGEPCGDGGGVLAGVGGAGGSVRDRPIYERPQQRPAPQRVVPYADGHRC